MIMEAIAGKLMEASVLPIHETEDKSEEALSAKEKQAEAENQECEVWASYCILASLSRAVGVLPWIRDKETHIKVKFTSWVNLHNLAIFSLNLGYQYLNLHNLHGSIEVEEGRYDLMFMLFLMYAHAVCSLGFFVWGYPTVKMLPLIFVKIQGFLDSIPANDRNIVLKKLKLYVKVSTVVYVAYGIGYLVAKCVENASLWSSEEYKSNPSAILFGIFMQLKVFIQMAFVCYGLTLVFITKSIVYVLPLAEACMTKAFMPFFRQTHKKPASGKNIAHQLNESYLLLTEIMDKTNDHFGKIILVQLWIIMVELLCCAFTIFNMGIRSYGPSTIVYFTAVILYMMFLCHNGSKLSSAGRSLRKCVTKIMNHATTTPYEKDQLNILRDSIISDPLELSASGFCIVDKRLVPAMITAVATYLIVFIQFKTAPTSTM